MDLEPLERSGVVLLGCGTMGSALLKGWLRKGLRPQSIHIIEPYPSEWLEGQPIQLNCDLQGHRPAVCVIAVKPQTVRKSIECVRDFGNGDTVIVSIVAGLPIAYLEAAFGPRTPIVRAMPNTPAAIGCGITALIGNGISGIQDIELAEELMSAAGETVRIDDESLMDAVTALSGSGPAYVFHLMEAMAAAGAELGLEPQTAERLAVATVSGAGKLAEAGSRCPAELRVDVTSPGGTTEAALERLMNADAGLSKLMSECMHAAWSRGRQLGAAHGEN